MRHIIETTITDRIFGNRQDRQGIEVTRCVRGLTVLLCLVGKRAMCHALHAHQAWMVRYAAASVAPVLSDSRRTSFGPRAAFRDPALVELLVHSRG